MVTPQPNDVTVWLKKIQQDKAEPLDHVIALVYDEIRTLAKRQMRSERADHTLCTTGLVNEVYLKFRNQKNLDFKSRAEFFSFASQCMRHILVDHARNHRANKRANGEKPASLETNMQIVDDKRAQEICDIDLALQRLEEIFPRGAQVLQYRLFGGLNLNETAEIINVSSKTIQRDWTSAIAWLRKEVTGIDDLLVERQ